MVTKPPGDTVELLEREPEVDEIDDDEPTKEELLRNLRESLRQSLAGETRPVEELIEEIRREQEAAEANKST